MNARIDDLINEWCDAEPGTYASSVPLHEYLGMTFEEYRLWLAPSSGQSGRRILERRAAARRDRERLQRALQDLRESLETALLRLFRRLGAVESSKGTQ